MLSATRQLIGMLDELELAQTAGESVSPGHIRDLFRVRDDARAEVEAATPSELRTEIEPAAASAIDEFNQDATAANRAGAESSRPAEDSARGEAVDVIDRIDASLQRAVRETTAPRPRRTKSARKAKPTRRKAVA